MEEARDRAASRGNRSAESGAPVAELGIEGTPSLYVGQRVALRHRGVVSETVITSRRLDDGEWTITLSDRASLPPVPVASSAPLTRVTLWDAAMECKVSAELRWVTGSRLELDADLNAEAFMACLPEGFITACVGDTELRLPITLERAVLRGRRVGYEAAFAVTESDSVREHLDLFLAQCGEPVSTGVAPATGRNGT